jgi:site-specific recombinase XerD
LPVPLADLGCEGGAGADLETLQDLPGHSSILVTADTYTSVLPRAQRR